MPRRFGTAAFAGSADLRGTALGMFNLIAGGALLAASAFGRLVMDGIRSRCDLHRRDGLRGNRPRGHVGEGILHESSQRARSTLIASSSVGRSWERWLSAPKQPDRISFAERSG